MADWPRAPLLLEINARPWLAELEEKHGCSFTLATVPEEEIDAIADQGFDALWLMGIWQRSPGSRDLAAGLEFLKREYARALPGYKAEDVAGSPYAISDYVIDSALGDEKALRHFRGQLARRGMRLILDFIPNHFALDHRWTREHPARLVQGTALDLKIAPGKYFSVTRDQTTFVFAHGRALYTSVWSDTVQLDYRREDTRQAMADYLEQIAALCDGVRCDMAMLVLREVFSKTWQGVYEGESQFWSEVIPRVKKKYPGFLFIGEVYWDYEYRMQQLGFDFVYDKVLYDRVLGNDPRSVFCHISGGSQEFQSGLVRFIENHDEQRVLEMVGLKHSLAAAALVLTLPGMRFFHEGQQSGCRINLPVQLIRRPPEEPLAPVKQFYARFLAALRTPLFREGVWKLLLPRNAAQDNESYANIIACQYTLDEELALVVVNLVSSPSQCFLTLDIPHLSGRSWLLNDQLSQLSYSREGSLLSGQGLFLDLPAYGYHLFRFESC